MVREKILFLYPYISKILEQIAYVRITEEFRIYFIVLSGERSEPPSDEKFVLPRHTCMFVTICICYSMGRSDIRDIFHEL